MKFLLPLTLSGLAAISSAALLATTTRYFDGQEGACGCGTSSGNFAWQLGIAPGVYTAAGSQALFDTDGASWCGGGCGKCYNLTSTGSAPCSTCGTAEPAGESIIVMVTNLCPNNGNEQWCPSVGGTNQYGFSYHFDIMAQNEVFGDNPVVEFEPVACPGQAATDWGTCVCFGQTASDETPAGLEATVPSSVAQIDIPSSISSPTAEVTAGNSASSTETLAVDPVTVSDPAVTSTLSTVAGSSTSKPDLSNSPEGQGKHKHHKQHQENQNPNACH